MKMKHNYLIDIITIIIINKAQDHVMGLVLGIKGESTPRPSEGRGCLPNQICKANCDFGKSTKHNIQYTKKTQSTNYK